jgi:hypothetical protein
VRPTSARLHDLPISAPALPVAPRCAARDIFATPSLTAFIDVTPRTHAAANAQLIERTPTPLLAAQQRVYSHGPIVFAARAIAAYTRHSSIAHRMPLQPQ